MAAYATSSSMGSGSTGGQVLLGCMEMSYFCDVNFESEEFLRIFLFRSRENNIIYVSYICLLMGILFMGS